MPSNIDLTQLYAIIIGKLKTRQDNSQPLAVSPELVVILDATRMLVDVRAATVFKSLVAAAGTYTAYHTVPVNKRWRLTGFTRGNSTGVTKPSAVVNGVEVDLGINSTSGGFIATDILLQEGDTIGLQTTGNAGDTVIYLHILYEEETIR